MEGLHSAKHGRKDPKPTPKHLKGRSLAYCAFQLPKNASKFEFVVSGGHNEQEAVPTRHRHGVSRVTLREACIHYAYVSLLRHSPSCFVDVMRVDHIGTAHAKA